MEAAASAAILVLGGYLTGNAGGSSEVARPPVVSTSPTQAGVLVASATDAGTDAKMTVRVTPAAGWVRVNAAVAGIPAGGRCRLVVVSNDGERQIAGSWVVPPDGTAGKGKDASLDGSAAVDPGQVKSVAVVNEDGKQYVSVPL
ncbi:hypothetical protein [Streptomyces flaveolus]|uniref:hypothetical protein n=1 Tax=Streptomyces flaveolus TaxID=67297 RepID=UPI003400F7B7